jgi:aminopeptidase N
LRLNGEQLELIDVWLDGAPLDCARYAVNEQGLVIADAPDSFVLETSVAIDPASNTALSGLYMSNGMFCTQCEAEGFRRIAFYPDRPDVLARFTTRVEADKSRYPVLLSNGNMIAAGDLDGGRHFVEWSDPFPKPSYLFALVAGDLAEVADEFVTMSGRRVALKVFVQSENRSRCGYTLASLKRAMRWDEEVFGREYDLDVFMIVAVDHFNFGAMENKGLNIFNSAYVLASPETATDTDYESIESIVAHEYFHNWSGNRVTCRDWFQLCLKEGFTVFRDQEFSADMRSAAVQRIKDVRVLKSRQFPEDQGPLAHPVRPESYITIDNFYTATVYEKGAELCRMIRLLIGPQDFRKGCDLYFETHDGTAATVEDFLVAMERASGRDLAQFRRWYSDAGTPRIAAAQSKDAAGRIALTLVQSTAPTPGQAEKPARHIPVAYAMIGAKSGAVLEEGVIELTEDQSTRIFAPRAERVVFSLLRGFSAPALLEPSPGIDDRLVLLAHEPDLFSRFAAAESLWRDLCLAYAGALEIGDRDAVALRFAEALGRALDDADHDRAFGAELLKAPSDADLVHEVDTVNPGAIAAGRRRARAVIAAALKPRLSALHAGLSTNAPFEPSAPEAGRRALRNGALSLLVAAGEDAPAILQAETAANMTDEAAAVAALAMSDSEGRDAALARFAAKWRHEPLVMNKWLAWRAMAAPASALDDVRDAMRDPAFDGANPNKVRALVGVFSAQNVAGFHRADGAAYQWFADELLAIDARNPQLAARLAGAFDYWRRLEPVRRAKARAALDQIVSSPNLSRNLFEIASRLTAEADPR